MSRIVFTGLTLGFLVTSCAPAYYGPTTESYTHQAAPSFLWKDRESDSASCGDAIPDIVPAAGRHASIWFRADSAGPAEIQLVCPSGWVLGTLLDTSIAVGFHNVKWYGRDRSDSLLLEGHFKYRVVLPDTAFEHDLTLTPPETPLAELQQDWPNPFSAGTSIHFYLRDSAAVELSLFNVLGETVRTLLDSTVCTPGYHRLVWDAKTDSSGFAPSGVYFYRLRTGDVSLTRKMTLIR